MWECPENEDDFNSKYSSAVGTIKTVKMDSPKPIYIKVLKNNTLIGAIADHAYGWSDFMENTEVIESLIFPFPYMGYVYQQGHWPTFLYRSLVKSVRRGWGQHSVSLETPSILRLFNTKTSPQRFRFITTPISWPIINFAWNHTNYKFKSIESIEKEKKPFAVLSSQFLAIAQEKNNWLLLYENFIVGTITEGEVLFNENADYLLDLFTVSVI